MKLKPAIVLLALFVSISLTIKAQVVCTIKGKVDGRESKHILLHKATDDVRVKSILIPIVEGYFEYQLTIPVSEAYHLVFEEELQRGFWRPILFFPESGVISFRLHVTENFDKNVTEGGKLNQILRSYNAAYSNQFRSRISSLNDSINKLTTNGAATNPKTNVLQRELEALYKKAEKWRNKYIEHNPSIVSYFLFLNDLQGSSYTNDAIKRRYAILSKRFPNHPYTDLAANKIETLESIKVGGYYIDFSAPDLDGNLVKISDFINGEFTLIDFWASWCGPCIKTSRTLIPVYERFKDKGLTIIGVARERKNSEAMQRVLSREKYPWLNLIELDDENQIWHKYNLSFAGGGIVLIHKSGKIIAIDPTEEELVEILQSQLTN